MLDDTIEQLRGMKGMVQMARNSEYTPAERHGYLMFAVMHCCQAVIYGNYHPTKYGFTISDYKHVLIKAAEAVMNGKSIDEAMSTVPEFQALEPIDWHYHSKQSR